MTLTQMKPPITRRESTYDPRTSGLRFSDAVATVLVAFVVVSTVAAVGDWGWPMLGSIRAAAGVVGLTGAAACAAGGRIDQESFKTRYARVMSVIGSLAAAAVIAALITGYEAMLIAFAGITVLLWISATTRHGMDNG